MEWKLELVIVPVSDVDRAKRFYSEQMGFVVDVDHRVGETFRVVQLTPPGSACAISIGVGLGDMPPGSLRGLHLCVPDVEAARADLLDRGVEVGTVKHFEDGAMREGPGGDYNSFLFFSDPDGNGWVVQEKHAHD